MIAANASLFIHFDNDADPNDSNAINRTSIGGSFATPLDTNGAYGIQIYFQTPFDFGSNIADHVQFSLDGVDNGSADERSDEAQNGGVWTNQAQWVNVALDTEMIVLMDSSSMNELHGPADYDVINPMTIIPGDLTCDGVVNLLDVSPFVAAISAGVFDPKADVNGDGSVNLSDIEPFVNLLTGG